MELELNDANPSEAAEDELLAARVVRRVLVPTDFSEGARRALGLAIRFAKLLRATIDLVHVEPMPAYVPLPRFPGAVPLPPSAPEVLEGIDHGLKDLRGQRARGRSRLPDRQPRRQRLGQGIVAYAAKMGAGLIVMGTHGRSGVRRVLLGSVAEQVLHKAACPVLVAPAAWTGLKTW